MLVLIAISAVVSHEPTTYQSGHPRCPFLPGRRHPCAHGAAPLSARCPAAAGCYQRVSSSIRPTELDSRQRAQRKRGHGGPAFTPRRSNERHDDSSPDHDTGLYKYIVKGGVHCQQRCLLLRFLLRSVTEELAPEWSAVSETCCRRLSCWQWAPRGAGVRGRQGD